MKNILLIDDSQFARILLRRILEKAGYTVCGEASNGREGVEKFKQLKPDLVFCDLIMGRMGGLECLRAILSEDPDANVVMCTSMGDQFNLKNALAMGAKEYIIKPPKESAVIQITEKLIGKSTSGSEQKYKKFVEEQAAAAGIDGRPVREFFDAFQQFSGLSFDDPKVTPAYLEKYAANIALGVRALLSAKVLTAQADQLIIIFHKLVSNAKEGKL